MPYTPEGEEHGYPLCYTQTEWKAIIDAFMANRRYNRDIHSTIAFHAKFHGKYFCPEGTDQSVIYIRYDNDGRGVKFWTENYAVRFYSTYEMNWGKGVEDDGMKTEFRLRKLTPEALAKIATDDPPEVTM